jgi:hypothetical protein
MAEVIKIDFLKRRVDKNDPVDVNAENYFKNIPLTEKGRRLFDNIKKIETLPSSAFMDKAQSIAVENYTWNELTELIAESTESEWNIKPAFFKAAVRKLGSFSAQPFLEE